MGPALARSARNTHNKANCDNDAGGNTDFEYASSDIDNHANFDYDTGGNTDFEYASSDINNYRQLRELRTT